MGQRLKSSQVKHTDGGVETRIQVECWLNSKVFWAPTGSYILGQKRRRRKTTTKQQIRRSHAIYFLLLLVVHSVCLHLTHSSVFTFLICRVPFSVEYCKLVFSFSNASILNLYSDDHFVAPTRTHA